MSAQSNSRPGLWLGLFIGSVAAIAGLRFSDAIEPPVGFILLFLSMGLLFQFVRALTRRNASCGGISQAIRRYNIGMMIAGLGYVLGLGTAITLDQQLEPGWVAGFALAMLPVIPIFGMIYVMARYLREEQDEYLRHRAINASLVGLACVLGIGSFWGFMETFDLVAHVPGWWSVPVWAIGMGLAQAWMAFTNRSDGEGA